MNLKIALVGAALFAGSTALAADPVSITCPAGARQGLLGNGDVACMNQDGSRAGGPMIMRYPNGKLMATGQTEGKGNFRTGKWTLFDEQGVKTHEIEFANGDFNGKWVEFFANGMVKKVQNYKAGQMVGAALEFDLTGKQITTTAAK